VLLEGVLLEGVLLEVVLLEVVLLDAKVGLVQHGAKWEKVGQN
jgi:hypothetical protein